MNLDPNIRGLIFDVDGTIKKWKETELLPNVAETFATFPPGHLIGFMTNQSGGVWRRVLNNPKYPTEEDIAEQILWVARELHMEGARWVVSVFDPRLLDASPDAQTHIEASTAVLNELLLPIMPNVYVSWNPTWRKPNGDALRYMADQWGHDRQMTLYVGDMDSDREAAEAGGLHYADAWQFFGWPEPEEGKS